MWSKRNGWIGIDVGSHAVKLAQLHRKGGQWRLSEAKVILRSPPWTAEDWLTRAPETSSQEITAGLQLGPRFRGRPAACLLPMALCDHRTIEVQTRDEREWRQQAQQQLQQCGLGGLGPWEMAAWDVPVSRLLPAMEEESEHHRKNVLAIRAAWAEQMGEDLRAAGLSGRVLDGLPFTLSRAASLMGSTSRPVAVIDWGCSRVTFCVVQDATPCYVRVLRDCQFDLAVATLCQQLHATRDEARKLLQNHGFPAGETDLEEARIQTAIEECLHDFMQGFLEELQRTLLYLRTQHSSWSPRQLYLTGGGATVRHIDHYLDQRCRLPVRRWHWPELEDGADSRFPMELLASAISLSLLPRWPG